MRTKSKNVCLRCGKPIGDCETHCSDRCYHAHLRHGPLPSIEPILRTHEREGRKYLQEIGLLKSPPARARKPAETRETEMAVDTIESFLRPQLDKQLLRWAVGREISCRGCGAILDVRRAVLADSPTVGSVVVCGTCWDKAGEHVRATCPDVEVTDGRKLGREE